MKANKHVFVEKPLCLSIQELLNIKTAYETIIKTSSERPILMVGFNRRFSPLIKKIKDMLDLRKQSKSVVMIINAGEISTNHWTQDLQIGGGRLNGEVCHFIDLLRIYKIFI